MENKKVNKEKNTPFQNLKNLSNIISNKEMNAVFSNIKTAKVSIDNFCKKVKDQMSKNEMEAQKIEQAKALAQKQQQQKVIEEQQPKASVNVDNKFNSNSLSNTSAKSAGYVSRTATTSQSTHPNNRQDGFNRNKSNNTAFADRNKRFDNTNKPQTQNRYNSETPRREDGYNSNKTSFPNKKPYTKDQNLFNKNDKSTFVNKDKSDKGNIISFTAGRGKHATSRPTTPTSFPPKSNNFGNSKHKNRVQDNEKKTLSVRDKMKMGYIQFDNYNTDENSVVRIKSRKARDVKKIEKIEITHAIITEDVLTIKILSEKIGKPASEIIKKFLILGLMYNINSVIDFATAELIASEFGITLEHKVDKSYEEKLSDMVKIGEQSEENAKYVKRPPIVTVMGHVDHGKTSLLDYIKKSHVVSNEAGGITQHIGAYSINVNNEDITFIDTPGHAAFSDMRARGATVADIAILIVAADDGVMPQTVEAIKHIKEAGVPMIVAINKIDKPTANIERIKQQLTEHDVLIEEWGGDTITVPVSAHTGSGIDKLLEMILLVAEMNEFKADPNAMPVGTCLESKVDTGRGIVASIIVKDGTLRVGDYILCGLASGRIKAMTNYKGESVKEALPSMAVSVIGLNNVPSAGDMAYVVDEKMAKNIIMERSNKLQLEKIQQSSGTSLEEFMSQSSDNEIKTFKVIVKADVQGTSEALKQTLEEIKNEEVVVSCISSGVGMITENDILMAKSSNVQIIGFNTKIDAKAKAFADKNGVVINLFKVIYDAVDYVTSVIESMKTPKYKENIIGKVEVRQLFKISSLGTIAGSYVLEGVINRNSHIKVMRGNEQLADTTVDTLRQQKDEARQVKSGFECGIKLKGFNDLKVGDILVVYENVRI